MRTPRSPRVRRTLAATALLIATLACDESPPTAAASPPDTSAAIVAVAAAQRPHATFAANVTAMGTLPLPVDQTVSTLVGTPALSITQTGTATDAQFIIANGANASAALYAVTTGNGPAAFVQTTTSTGIGPALRARTGGLGRAGDFVVNNALNLSPALSVTTDGRGQAAIFSISNVNSAQSAVRATTSGTGAAVSATSTRGRAGDFAITSTSNGSAAVFTRTAGNGPALQASSTGGGIGTGPAVSATHSGTGSEAGKFVITNAANGRAALYAQTVGGGAAGFFQGTTRGLLIVTNAGGTGLQVLNGTKQAVVATPGGARSLYTEEATEVWFADYGFARLRNGRVRVPLDSTFAQTVNASEPYHVFVQPYGDAELMVRERSASGFLVVLRAGGDRDAEFSFRVVARRRGFERTRLEHAPWVDEVIGDARARSMHPSPLP